MDIATPYVVLQPGSLELNAKASESSRLRMG